MNKGVGDMVSGIHLVFPEGAKVFFNFLYAPSGGGYQNSLSFVETLISLDFDFSNITFFVFSKTELETICKKHKIAYKAISNTVLSKYRFELLACTFVCKNDVVFSLFGPPMLGMDNRSINIGGMAISNVLHKEIDFWGYLGRTSKAIKTIKDVYRKYRYRQLDYWIFETELLKEKAINEFKFPAKRTEVIKMTPSILVSPDRASETILEGKGVDLNVDNKFLFLCGAHPNKRLHVLPELAKYLDGKGVDFSFIFTLVENSYFSDILVLARKLGVEKYFNNVGPVQPGEVASVISAVDFVCTFSLLESFSNNFVEAWAMRKPLIVTAKDWAEKSCGQAALYVNVDEQSELNQQVFSIINNVEAQQNAVESGLAQLSVHPTVEEKALKYISTINKAIVLGKISNKERRRICL